MSIETIENTRRTPELTSPGVILCVCNKVCIIGSYTTRQCAVFLISDPGSQILSSKLDYRENF